MNTTFVNAFTDELEKLMKRIAKGVGRTAKGSALGYLLGMPPAMLAALAYRGATGKPLLVDTRRRSKK